MQHFAGLIKNCCLKKCKFSSGFAPFTHGKKKNSEYYDTVSAIVILYLKRKVLYKFPPKCFKTTERHSLTVCGSVFGEKQFLLIYVALYWFDQNLLFNKSKFFSVYAPFKHGKKPNFLSISVVLSEIVSFLLKWEVLCEFPQKCFKTTERDRLAIFGSLCGEKLFLLIVIPFYWFD